MEYLDLYSVEFSIRKMKYRQFSAVLFFYSWAVNPLCFFGITALKYFDL